MFVIGLVLLYFGFSFCTEEGDSVDDDFPEFLNMHDDERISEKFKPDEIMSESKQHNKESENEKVQPNVRKPPNFGEASADIVLERLIDEEDNESEDNQENEIDEKPKEKEAKNKVEIEDDDDKDDDLSDTL